MTARLTALAAAGLAGAVCWWAAALAKGSLAALRSGISVHVDNASVTQNGTTDNSQDLTAKAGRAIMTLTCKATRLA